MKRTMQQGFTLIELMIVVAIIGILAAVALPAYQNYVTKSKMAATLASLASMKTAISLCHQEKGGDLAGCDSDAANATTPGPIPFFKPTNEIATAVVDDGEITVTFASNVAKDVSGKKFKMKAKDNGPTLIWELTNVDVGNPTAISALGLAPAP